MRLFAVEHAVIYEQPLNERVRTSLRLEFLFRQALHTLHGDSRWEAHATIGTLMNILEILTRTDLKTELLKEMDRHQVTLSRLRGVAGVDQAQLDRILDRLGGCQERLRAAKGQLCQALREDEFLTSLRQRANVPGGMCDFDLPAYHLWLQQPAAQRSEALQRWFAGLDEVRKPLLLLLELLRDSADGRQETAAKGFYQQALDPNTPYQLIRVELPADAPYFAEVSAGRHRFSVRFMQPQKDGRPVQVREDVPFYLSCCAL